jgi:8-oxo-dGTP pyrophosphatase MutT (NUDIX family)
VRRGAVLVPIFAKAPHHVIFVERAHHLRRDPGQIGFPGGSAEPVDAGDPVKTALREASEEIGVAAELVSIIGTLPDLRQVSSELLITPIVGVLDATTLFSLDGEEIVGVFGVPLASVLADGGVHEDVKMSRLSGKTMYALDYEGHHIWGFTGRILKSFVDAWSVRESVLRRAVEAVWRESGR